MGLKAFRDANVHHGDIQPSSIFVLDNKSLKLLDVSFINNQESGFLRKYKEYDFTTPLSPQAMQSLIIGPEISSSFDKEKNDIWSIGITVLSALVNEDFNMYYDWKNYQIFYDLIRNRMIRLEKDYGYSKEFTNILEKLLERDEFERIGVVQLTELLGFSYYRESYTEKENIYQDMDKGAIGGGDLRENMLNFHLKEKKVIFFLKKSGEKGT